MACWKAASITLRVELRNFFTMELVNIWAADKDATIKHLLLLLSLDLSETRYVILDDKNTDSRAVRLAHTDNSGHCIYIYTYGQKSEHYGVHLEYPQLDNINPGDAIETYDDLNYNQLLELLRNQFM